METAEGFKEGKVAKAIEQRTKTLPSDWFLWAAVGSIGVSLAMRAMHRKEDSNFIGQWAPTLLLLGLYNKLVKLQGSESPSSGGRSESRHSGGRHSRSRHR